MARRLLGLLTGAMSLAPSSLIAKINSSKSPESGALRKVGIFVSEMRKTLGNSRRGTWQAKSVAYILVQ
jgi:hypothetical protein